MRRLPPIEVRRRGPRFVGGALAATLALCAGCKPDEVVGAAPDRPHAAATGTRAAASADPRIEMFEVRSERLSAFAGTDVAIKAAVITPSGYDPNRGHPSFFYVHGFGGTAETTAARFGRGVQEHMARAGEPAIVYALLDASHALGHHAFADSPNTGPWGSALVEEFIPAFDERYGTDPRGRARFVGGHSSGGWSSLWLQIQYPHAFGGVWSTAPDPVDFRDFVGVDIYRYPNAYTTPAGSTVQLVYRGEQSVMSLREYVADEVRTTPIGGQFHSFDAVFSPRRADGTPAPLFDRGTGVIDPEIAESWRAHDISWLLRTHWNDHREALAGKLHIIVGSRDTYGLQRPVQLLQAELSALGSDAEFVIVEGRDHSDLYDPHPVLYPEGLQRRIEAEVLAKYERP